MERPRLTVEVTTRAGRYLVDIGSGLLAHPQSFSPNIHHRSVCIISHPTLTEYLNRLKATCEQAGASRVETFLLPDGETSKTLASSEKIWSFLLEHHFDRQSVLIALGGGVIGDLVGFAAACYLRGIDIIHCPTSLLAQVDSAIGGKVAVNHALAKNSIGAFYPPLKVIVDPVTLATLPERELRAALAEVVKYGLILDENWFIWLEQNKQAILERDPEVLQHIVAQCCQYKANIVSEDEQDTHVRAILNFGHTLGHAIESALSFQGWRHGEAVSVGLVAATHLSWQKGTIALSDLERLVNLLSYFGLPIAVLDGLSIEACLSFMKLDKKSRNAQVQWVLLEKLGKAVIHQSVHGNELMAALRYCGAKG